MKTRTSWHYLPPGHGLGAASTADFKGDVVGVSLLDLWVEAAGNLRSRVCGNGEELGHLAHGVAGHDLRKYTCFNENCGPWEFRDIFMISIDYDFLVTKKI